MDVVRRTPGGGGLGGGAGDGQAGLRPVNALAGDAVPRPELLHLATRLGADVAFFASGAPAAVAGGRGERLFRFTPPPAAPALLAVPPTGVPTPDAYRWRDAPHPDPPPRGPVGLHPAALARSG